MTTASRFDMSILEGAQKVPGKPRHKTREVKVGSVVIGGTNPVAVQSMTTTDTFDVEATVQQIQRLEEAGCELVRVTVPKPEDAGALTEIKKRIGIPLICDIHFDYKMALAALDHPHTSEILALRRIILGADARIGEEIKWNAPSFYTTEHFATFQLRAKGGACIILHLGAKPRDSALSSDAIDDPGRLLKWLAKDRASATFRDLADVDARATAFAQIIRQWIAFL